ncbi:hypothetical protein [Actinomadura livida]|uniref:Peptidase inhibitor family I36 protein n=1 Tax=Actinomadura livida TaxID=79909 RepID=A0A7W7IB01_9ACTN|nr:MULTISPECIES: hypothetical protein [Actinomadura]MBB4773777.1 hypothetical protein [Actinomadura catellatispora]GGU10649.1 hypothetical protein GCM10010208_39190 [Actinomadura livida]
MRTSMSGRSKRAIAVGTLATAMAGGGLLATASAASADSAPADNDHCVTNVATGQMQCYDTFPQAISAATGGQITDAPQSPAAAVASRSFEQRINAAGRQAASSAAPLATVTLSIEYDWNYYQTTAGSNTYTGTSGCDSDGSVEWMKNNLGDSWNDRISSFKGYNGCQVRHFQHENGAGAYTTPVGQNPSMMDHGGLNNQASSIHWI